MATIQITNTPVSTIDALWALFKSLPISVRQAFAERLHKEEKGEENTVVKDNTKEMIAKHAGKWHGSESAEDIISIINNSRRSSSDPIKFD